MHERPYLEDGGFEGKEAGLAVEQRHLHPDVHLRPIRYGRLHRHQGTPSFVSVLHHHFSFLWLHLLIPSRPLTAVIAGLQWRDPHIRTGLGREHFREPSSPLFVAVRAVAMVGNWTNSKED
jgi:hypothetical protein